MRQVMHTHAHIHKRHVAHTNTSYHTYDATASSSPLHPAHSGCIQVRRCQERNKLHVHTRHQLLPAYAQSVGVGVACDICAYIHIYVHAHARMHTYYTLPALKVKPSSSMPPPSSPPPPLPPPLGVTGRLRRSSALREMAAGVGKARVCWS